MIDQKSKTGLCRGCYLAQSKIKRSVSSVIQCRNDNCSQLVDPKSKIDLCKECLAIVVDKNQKTKGCECYPKIRCACCILFSDQTTIMLVEKVIESSNILLLGMSYSDRNKAIENELGKRKYGKKEHWEKRHDERELKRLAKPNLSNTIELAQRELITKMDGRDQARIDTIEAKGTVKVFTVSLQTNFHFDQTRHCNTDFNGKRFISDIKELGGDRSYKQVRECR